MTSNSQSIIQDMRQEFESLIDFVTNEQAQTATADYMERSIFARLLALGAKLLLLFFVVRSAGCDRTSYQTDDGQTWSYERDSKRDYGSIFGKVPIFRPYFYRAGEGGHCPLDAELALGDDCYSDLVRELADYLAIHNAYKTSSNIFSQLLGLELSTRAIKQNLAKDAVDVNAYYAQKAPPEPQDEAEILVIQADGKGVPIIYDEPQPDPVRLGKGQKRGRKKEAVVTTVYTIATQPRTPQEVVASYFNQTAASKSSDKWAKPLNKQVWATLDGKDAALERLSGQVDARQGDHIRQKVALCDGCPALQTRLREQFGEFPLVLDFIHANEYLWDVANSLLGEQHPDRTEWMMTHTEQILSGQTQTLIDRFREMAQSKDYSARQRRQLQKTADYFARNLAYMDYESYLARGWPIATGVIEGACRHLVKDRCELSGMRWRRSGAESVLHLRAVAENGDWEEYHRFRQEQRHQRLYNAPYPQQQEALEIQAIEEPELALAGAPADGAATANNTTPYHQLSLAA